MEDKILTVGIPAYKAQSTICEALASIMIQTAKESTSVIIVNDNPGDDYEFVKDRYTDLDINIIDTDKNIGPGIARQKALDACKTDWITFMDADDVFINPVAIEMLINNITPNCVEVQGAFYQECDEGNINAIMKQQIIQNNGQIPPRMIPRNDIQHPWVFGRLYNVNFLRDNDIRFSKLRAMEDGEFNWKVKLSVEGSPFQINLIEDPIYFWRTGSEHSITRIGIEENDGEPLYNWDLCQVGATAASINAIKFCKEKNPFNGNITRFTVEMMIGQYFTYIKCIARKPLFAEQNLFNAKRFYYCCYKEIENQINDDILKTMYTAQLVAQSNDMISIIPEITFFDFMKKIKEDPYGGEEEFNSIRKKLPEWIIKLDKKSGVLGDEGYIHTINEI